MLKKNKPIKKATKKSDSIKNNIPALILCIGVIVFMVTMISYSKEKGMENIADKKISSLDATIAQTQKDIIKEKAEVTAAEEKKVEKEKVSYPQTEIKFDKCSVFNSFNNEIWYQKFWDKAKELEFTPYSVSSACLSNGADMFIAIAQKGLNCEGPQIYRFNTKGYQMEPATVTDKGKVCMGSLDSFGKRFGDVIKVVGKSSNTNCSYEDSFDYNFRLNTITLTKSRSLCKDTGAKTTNF